MLMDYCCSAVDPRKGRGRDPANCPIHGDPPTQPTTEGP